MENTDNIARPAKGEKYAYLETIDFGNHKLHFVERVWNDTPEDYYLLLIGNVFHSPKEAVHRLRERVLVWMSNSLGKYRIVPFGKDEELRTNEDAAEDTELEDMDEEEQEFLRLMQSVHKLYH